MSRILQFSSSFLPPVGGAELALHYLAQGMVAQGHFVAVAYASRGFPYHERDYEVHRVTAFRGAGKLGISQWILRRRLAALIRAWHPDVVHAHFLWPAGCVAVPVCRAARVPLLLTAHGEDIQRKPEIGYGHRLDPRLDRKIREAALNADGLIAVSPDIHKEYTRLGVSSQRIHDIPPVIDFQALSSPDPSARASLGLDPESLVALAVGRNHRKKNFIGFIKAISIAARSVSNIVGIIVGRGVPELSEAVKDMEAERHIRLYGPAAPPGLKPNRSARPRGREPAVRSLVTFYKAADVFVMPSVLESAGSVTIEAMAAGLPIVAAPAPGTLSFIRHDVNGLLAASMEPADIAACLLSLLASPEMRSRMGKAGTDFARERDCVNVARLHLAAYEAVRAAYPGAGC